jgi:hypothetical protein
MIIYNFGEERLLNNWKRKFSFPKNLAIILDKEVNKLKIKTFHYKDKFKLFMIEMQAF